MQIKTRFHSWLLGALLCVAQWAGAAPGQPERLHFSAVPTEGEIFAARVFDEPIVPLSAKANAKEDRALADAFQAYADRQVPDVCSSLATFAARFPESRWTGPLLTHLGTEYYNYGYFSKALDAWEQAWKLCEKNHYAPAKPESDRALGELARMYARIGRMSELSRLLDSTKDRDLSGPGTQLIHAATEALWVMQNKPDYAFQCGPFALERILRSVDPSKANSALLQDFKSPTNGFGLSEVAGFSDQLGMHYQMAFRSKGAQVIVPAVVHWKVGHYAAITGERDGKVLAQDYTFRGSIWMSLDALDNEASGYFLVPPGPLPAGWRQVSAKEVRDVRGKGFTNGQDPHATTCHDTVCGGTGCASCNPCGMAAYTFHALLASLTVQDTPINFFTPVGPEIEFTATYNQLEADQPAVFPYSNLGPKWTCNWISYITDNPGSPGSDVNLYEDGGGSVTFTGFNPATQSYATEAMSQAVLTRLTSSSYEMVYPDGSRREFAKSDGSVGSSRRIFVTQVLDATGKAATLNYDAQLRVTNIVNAINQATTFGYTNAAFSNAITSVTDPFGRSAYFQYNGSGLLTQITDTLGLNSQFTYGANQFINALTTPYGMTTFITGSTNGGTFLEATDPLGGTELLEYSQASGIPHSLPASEVPHGLATFNLFIDGRDSLYWSKKAFEEGAWDWTKAKIYHWLHQAPSGNNSARILESEKNALEGRVWYNYAGQSTNFGAPYYLDAAYTGASDQPSVAARVLDDGTTQLSTFGYNILGNITNYTDPVGRNFTFVYASNNMDVLETRMTRNGKNELLGSATYNSQHLPLTVTDEAGQTTIITYDSHGQILSITDPKNETISFNYDTNGFPISILGPLAAITNDTATLTYDAYNRIHTVTDTEGYTIAYDYDVFDRPVMKTYPDGTFEQLVYDRLDLVAVRDRLGRWTTNTYNANQQLLSVRDSLGRLTLFDWCKCGLLEGISDSMGRVTSWTYDVQSRPVTKRYADGSMDVFTYETSGGRMRMRTDTKGQQEVVEYYADDEIKSVSYPGAANPTAPVTFTYDPDYDRVLTMQDGVGTTVYSYNPITLVPSLGAGQLHSISGPLPNSAVVYQYDQLGRVVSRAINGVSQDVAYDALSRATTAVNSLGSFQYSYVNATSRLRAAAYPNGQTNLYSYYNNAGDQRLKQILNLKPGGGLLSSFSYAYDAVGKITSWTNEWDTLPERVWNFSYDAGDELVRAVRTDGIQPLSTNGYAYDLGGNRTAALANGATNNFSYNALNQIVGGDTGLTNTTYEWDAADRLTAINRGSHRTEFTYDGVGRRARIVEKEANVVVADNRFLWCDDALCEERDSTGATVVRRFFPQGESIVGSGTTNIFYTRDHLDSIREALDSTGTLQTRYDYDPYGRQTVVVESLTPSFGYTGHFQHKTSGLYLARERALDPNLGRWLNRDPMGEAGGLNLYSYVDNDPVTYTDPLGLCCSKSVGKKAVGNYLSFNEFLRVEGFLFRFQPAVKTLENGKKLTSVNNLVHPLFTLPRGDLLKQANMPTVKTASGALSVAGALWSAGNNAYDDYKNGAGAANTAIDGGATLSASLLVSANPVTGAANLVTGGAASALVGNGINGVVVGGKTLFSSRVTGREQAAIKKMFTRNWATAALWKAGEWLAGTDDPPCRKTPCPKK